MLSTKCLYRLGVAVLVGAATLTSETQEARGGNASNGVAPSDSAPRKGLVAAVQRFAPLPGVSQTCALGTPSACYDSIGSAGLNPASFFDKSESTTDEHYFIKLYENDTGSAVVIEGMGYEARASASDFNEMKAAGGVYAGPAPLFPSPEALLNLPTVEIQGVEGGETCVPFTDEFGRPVHIDTRGTLISSQLVLQPDEFAWLVLRFPNTGSAWVKILVDNDDNDHLCDYMSIDGGQTWYQPDPLNGPIFDWGITAYTNAGQNPPGPAPPTWSTVKKLYIDE